MNANKLKYAIPAKVLRESGDMDQYADDFQKYVEKRYKYNNFFGWKLSIDRHAGTFEWNKPGNAYTIMATPFFDGQENLPINIVDDDGKDTLSKIIRWKPTKDMVKDFDQYFRLLKPFIHKLK